MRDETIISQPLATLIALYANDQAPLPDLNFEFARPIATAGSLDQADKHPIDGTIQLEGGRAVLSLQGQRVAETIGCVCLSDGSKFLPGEAVLEETGRSWSAAGLLTTTKFHFVDWSWRSVQSPVAWVGILSGVRFGRVGNLVVQGRWGKKFRALRLGGYAQWHFVRNSSGGRDSVVVVLCIDGPISERLLERDFLVLEFLFGRPLQMSTLVGLDANGRRVAAFGSCFGYRYREGVERAPVVPDTHQCAWMAAAFPLIVQALDQAEPQAVWGAITTYVDSTVGHLDGQYLFAQVGLEGLAYRIGEVRVPLVKSVEAWERWVKESKGVWASHARDERAVCDMHSKLKDVSGPTTSNLVRGLFGAWKLNVPEEALKEIRGRNTVAHTAMMNRGGESYDAERDTRRIRMIRVLLATMLLRYVGYDGPLNGWERDGRGGPIPAEWAGGTGALACVAADERFFAIEAGQVDDGFR